MSSRTKTFIGYRPLAPHGEFATAPHREFASDDLTELVDSGERPLEHEVRYTSGSSVRPLVLSQAMLELLKQKLREAEAKELGIPLPDDERT